MTLPNFAATFLQEAEELLRQIEGAALELEAEPVEDRALRVVGGGQSEGDDVPDHVDSLSSVR